MFITKSKHSRIVSNLETEIQQLKKTLQDNFWKIDRLEADAKELKEIKFNNRLKLNNYLIVIGADSQIDVKGHFFELDDGALTVYRCNATGKETIFHCNKFQYITISE